MNTSLTRFKIEGLHNLRTIDIPIEDNTLVLVGENGTGKSTVVNFIYFLLTSQWSRMADTVFKSVTAEVDGENYAFSRESIQSFAHEDQFFQNSRIPRSLYDELETVAGAEVQDYQNYLARLSTEYRVPTSILRRELIRLRDIPHEDRSKANALRKATGGSILYLPTYRRIEQDLETVLPDIDIERFRRTRMGVSGRTRKADNIELVEFGMEDVEHTLRRRMNEIGGKVRQDLSNLTGAYLRDIIRGAYKTVSAEQLAVLEEYTVDDNIFRRIPDEILPTEDKRALKKIIEEITDLNQIDNDNRVVAHFLTKLVEFYEKQQEDEKDLRDFMRVCNESYLSGKQFVYDDVDFDVFVEQRRDAEHSSRIPMQALSSGEKQIVSLFSHLYLSAGSDYFVIIDEPELSLSVPWQRNFLPDIRKRSRGLVAVTHSPFIYDNELKPYTHSLEEFSHSFEYDPELAPVVSASDILFMGA